MIKAVIFDLDGTLIDTEKIYCKLWPRACADFGYLMTEEMWLSLRSLGRPFAVERFKEWYGEDFDYDMVRGRRKELFEEYLKDHSIERKPGAEELLRYLNSRGLVTAIATATDPERTEKYLTMVGLRQYFSKVVSATMVERGKPDPGVYLYACEQLGFKPSECIAVEDAPNGVLSAARAGCRVIMVPDRTEPDAELMKFIFKRADSLYDLSESEDIYL